MKVNQDTIMHLALNATQGHKRSYPTSYYQPEYNPPGSKLLSHISFPDSCCALQANIFAISGGSPSRSVAWSWSWALELHSRSDTHHSPFFVGSSKWFDLEKASAFTFSIPFLWITMNSNWAKSANQCWKILSSDFMLTMYSKLDASVWTVLQDMLPSLHAPY